MTSNSQTLADNWQTLADNEQILVNFGRQLADFGKQQNPDDLELADSEMVNPDNMTTGSRRHWSSSVKQSAVNDG